MRVLLVLLILLLAAPGAAQGRTKALPDAQLRVLAQAAQAMKDGQPKEAEALVRKLADKRGSALPAQAWHLLGNALHAQNRPGEAARAFASGLAEAPDDPALHRNLGIAAYDAGDFALAAEHLERAAALAQPTEPDLAYQAAAAHYQAGAPREAMRLLLPLAETPSAEEPWLELLAASALACGDAARAEAVARRGLRADPGAKNWWRLTARLRQKAGDLAGAAAALEALVHLEPAEAEDLRCLAGLYFAQDASLLGARALERAAGPDPGPEDLDALADALARAGRLDDALRRMDAAQARSPRPERLLRKALLLRSAGRDAQAAGACREALDAGSLPLKDEAQAWMLLGTACFDLDRPDQAREAFEQAARFPATAAPAGQYLEALRARAEMESGAAP